LSLNSCLPGIEWSTKWQNIYLKALTTNGEPKEFFFSSDGCATVKHMKNYLAVEDDETVLVMVFFKLLAFFVSEGSSNLI
jgi:hypothetical protein